MCATGSMLPTYSVEDLVMVELGEATGEANVVETVWTKSVTWTSEEEEVKHVLTTSLYGVGAGAGAIAGMKADIGVLLECVMYY